MAAHSLYEKSDPYVLPGPGGTLDLHETKFEQLSDNQVKVSGTKFIATEDYFVKLEGVRLKGYRTISPAATHDPVMISQMNGMKLHRQVPLEQALVKTTSSILLTSIQHIGTLKLTSLFTK